MVKEYVIDALEEVDKIFQSSISPCIEEARVKLDEVRKTALKSLLDCADNLAKRVEGLRENIKKEIKAIEDRIIGIKDKAVACFKQESIGGQIQCVAELVPEATNTINTIVTEYVPKIMSDSTNELLAIQKEARERILEISQKSRDEIREIVKNVPGCILN
jgi:ElaB/YqjD/DUF883 family membrane-anchored ribosome-binding protein